VAAALAMVLTLGAAACTDDGDDGADDVSTVDAEIGDPATVESSSTAPEDDAGSTAAPETTPETTPTTAAPVGAPEPEESAATYYMAWKAGDPALASTVAEPAAVDAMDTIAEGDYSLYNRCNTGEFGQSSCLYRGNPGTIQFAMAETDGNWVVTTVFFSPA